MKHTTESIEKYTAVIREYLANDDVYDFLKFAEAKIGKHMQQIHTLDEWADFVKEHLSEDAKKKFVKKAFPFKNEDGSENEELKNKLHKIAYRIFQRSAGLIEVIDEVTPNMNEFIYMLKQLRFVYKTIPSYVYNEAVKFYSKVSRYHKETRFDTSISMTPQQSAELHKVIEERGIPLNNTTYYEAYKYLVRKGKIVLSNNSKR